jgi:hypothetical protein
MSAGVIVAIVFGALVLICGGVGLIGAIINQSQRSSSSSTSGGDYGLSTSTGSTGSSTQNAPLSDPKGQALKIMNVFHNEDWRGMFSLIAVSANNKSSLQDPDAFAQGMSTGLNSGGQDSAVVHELFRSMQNIRVEEPSVTGDKASVPCSCTVTISGTTKDFVGVVNLTLDNGEWKWDLTGSDDLQAESAKQTKALLGTPR